MTVTLDRCLVTTSALTRASTLVRGCAALAAFALSACGGGGNSGTQVSTAYMIGGTVTGLSGSGLVVQNNGGANIAVGANGAFSFPGSLSANTSYAVTVVSHPTNPAQTCSVTNAAGTVTSANVTNIEIACTTNSYEIGGVVTGLNGTGLIVQLNGASDLSVSVSGTFAFAGSLPSGTNYAVTIASQPTYQPSQICSVSNGTGVVTSSPVTSVTIHCRAAVGRYLYVPVVGADSVAAFAIDPSSGELTPLAGMPFAGGGTQPRLGITTIDQRFLYINGFTITTPYSGSISGYSISPSTGVLTPVPNSPLNFAHLVNPVRIHPSGNYLYFHTLGNGMPSINAYQINSQTGELAIVAGSPYPIIASHGELDPQGRFYYAFENSLTARGLVAYGVDQSTGALTETGRMAVADLNPTRSTIDSTGRYLYAFATTPNFRVLGFVLNQTSGIESQLPSTAPDASRFGVSIFFSRWGHLYVPQSTIPVSPATSGPGSIGAYSIDQQSGSITPIGGSPFATAGNLPNAVTIDPSGRFMIATNTGSGTIAVLQIDSSTGALSHVSGSPFTPACGANPGAITVDPSGRFIYFTDSGTNSVCVYSLDVSTGALAFADDYVMNSSISTAAPNVVGLQ